PHQGPLRLRRPQRPRRLPQYRHQEAGGEVRGNPNSLESVNTSTELAEALQNAIDQPEKGVVGLADDLLRLCPESGMRLDWFNDCCRIRFFGTNEAIDVPIRKSAFRALLARISALCNDKSQQAVSP